MAEEFPSNSFKSRREAVEKKEREIPKVKGEVKYKKKSTFDKLISVFIPEDVDSVPDYILYEILLPSVKRTTLEIFQKFLGDGKSSNINVRQSPQVSYTSYSNKNRTVQSSRYSSAIKSSYDDIVLESQEDARYVLDSMNQIIDEDNCASIKDLYSLIGRVSQYTDDRWGWYNLQTAYISIIDDDRFESGVGYALDLPKAVPLQ